MAKIDSFKRWLLILQKLRKTNCSFNEISNYLIDQQEITGYNFDISTRTFQRDLKDIESYFGIEIKFNKKDGVYEIVEEESNTSYERIIEAFDIVSALKTTEKVSQYVFLEKRKPKGTEHFHGLLHAIQNQLIVTFIHESFWNEYIKKRKCVPVAIKEAQNRWYLIAYDIDKKDFRNFGLDRISNVEITPNKQIPPTFNIEEYYANAFGIECYETAQKVVLEVDNSQKKYFQTLPLHHSQTIVKETKNSFIVEYFIHPTHDFAMEILRFGDWCKVVEPIWYREKMKDIVKQMNKKYAN